MTDYEERIESFFAKFTELQFNKSETIIGIGKEPDGIYYLRKGHVRQYSISEHTGNILTLHIYHEKSFFPMIWAMTGKKNTFFFDAMGSVILYRAPKDEVLSFISADTEVLYHFSTRLLAGLNGLLTRLETLAFTDVYGRLISVLLYLTKHFGEQNKGGILLAHFTHQEIAEFIGVARETASLAIEKLQKKGLIQYKGRNIYIPNPENLIKELNLKRNR